MKTVTSIITRIQNAILAFLVVAFITVILFATFCRYFKIMGLQWPDELARYLMIWMVFIGCGAAAQKGAHFAIELIYVFTPQRLHTIFILGSTLVTDIVMLTIVFLALETTQKQIVMHQVSAAMNIPMWFMYLSVPVGCFLIIVQGTFRALRLVKHNTKGGNP